MYNYEYDQAGNRTKKTHIDTGAYVEYQWDQRNRLTRVSFRNSSGTLLKDVFLIYDPLDRMIRKEVDDNGNGTIDREERLVYDADDLILGFDANSSLKTRYLHAVDQVFAQEAVNGDILWALGDHQGTTRDVADYNAVTGTTSIANHLKYSSFGEITDQTNASKQPTHTYLGARWDNDTELIYFGARSHYDPGSGNFISQNPAGFGGGDANLTRLAGNTPVNILATGLAQKPLDNAARKKLEAAKKKTQDGFLKGLDQLRREVDKVRRGTGFPRPIVPGKPASYINRMSRPDPRWKPSRSTNPRLHRRTGENSAQLRRRMENAPGERIRFRQGTGRRDPGDAGHHIVPSTDRRAKAARDLLDKYRIDTNSHANGVKLTTREHRRLGLHTGPAIDRVKDQLKNAVKGAKDWADGRQKLLDELWKIHNETLKRASRLKRISIRVVPAGLEFVRREI